MYTALIAVFLITGVFLLIKGIKSSSAATITLGAVFITGILLLFGSLSFWGEYLWFENLGYEDRFLTFWTAEFLLLLAGFIGGAGIVFLTTIFLGRDRWIIRLLGVIAAGLAGASFGGSNWQNFLIFTNRVSTGVLDPVLGKDTGFYLFAYPLITNIIHLLILLIIFGLITSFLVLFIRLGNDQKLHFFYQGEDKKKMWALWLHSGLLIILLGIGKYFQRYGLMYSEWGVVQGPGWTDVNIRMPAYLVVAGITILGGIFILLPSFRNKLYQKIFKKIRPPKPIVVFPVLGILLFFWVLLLNIIPGLVQWLRVTPNEISFEKPYIANNIEFTRRGFDLHKVKEKEFPASENLTPETIRNNKRTLDNVRLWDWKALDAVYQQFQEIRLYYEFVDVDIDRYMINNEYRQVMVSAREMQQANLAGQSQTFVNKRFKYTHGFGITLTTVNEFTEEGLPRLLIKDIPPKSTAIGLEIDQPRIYYGELTDQHVIVNTKEKEFDYPRGQKNVYNKYKGKGGVALDNIWKRFLFGYKFDGTKLFLSEYPTDSSRIMFHRQIRERVETLAPFLHFDNDPYIVLSEGKLFWIIDAYTVSDKYPYSEYFNGINYIRNSVKVVIDAYEGSVDFYIFDENDPLIKVWSNIFEGMFREKADFPQGLLPHVRYPVDYLLIQGEVYSKYHMTDPEVFYNQEDLWIQATEKYHGGVIPVEPYYIMWEKPESDELEFVLILPFTPKNRQVAIGWIAGMSDPEHYGELLSYKFPKDKRVLGPQQVETKIDQDPVLSQQLTLWDQRGSQVLRGNVLAIPIDGTITYIEPIYLKAETAAYPELRLVVIMHNDNLSYAPTFDQALEKLFDKRVLAMEDLEEETPGSTGQNQDWGRKAKEAFDNYLKFTGEENFEEASMALKQLKEALQNLTSDNRVSDSSSTE